MTRQPRLMLVLAAGYFLVAFSMPLQVMLINNYSVFDLALIFNQMTMLNVLIAMTCIALATSLYRSSGMALALLPLLTTMVVYNNYLVGQYEYQYSAMQALIASITFMSMSSSIYLIPFVRQPLMDSSKRWWRTPKRMKTSFETSLHPFVGASLAGATFDLSETGFFIAEDGVKPKKQSTNFKGIQDELRVGDRTGVLIKVAPGISVKCEARVVRRSDGKGHYPRGLGFQFEKLDGLHRKMIRNMIQDAVAA
jgi:hypothetical protein